MRLRFRARLFIILLLFAVVPAAILTAVWGGMVSRWLPRVSATTAWERVAATGERALELVRGSATPDAREAALRAHEQELRSSVEQARRFRFLAANAVPLIVVVALLLVLALALGASRVAGHLSRQLSRPLGELVEWTEMIARATPLPDAARSRGAPEFEVLRRRMRKMARELELGRQQVIEAERLAAFRETARRVAHELKNPLTPIRFAVERLRREAPPELREAVEVLAVESSRLEDMARSFAQFGRLPEGPPAEVDLAELVRYAARTSVPSQLPVAVEVEEGVPMVRGHHDALARALANVLLNAVDACKEGGSISVRVARARTGDRDAVELLVRDTGCGIAPEQLASIWDPYVTHKSGGTGLGLAIARQTVTAHGGTVDASSAVGQGTEIRFVLPVETSTAEAARAGEEKAS